MAIKYLSRDVLAGFDKYKVSFIEFYAFESIYDE